MPEMSREDRENVREVEEQLARASNIPDITGPEGEVLVAGRRPDHLPVPPTSMSSAGVVDDVPPDEIVIPEGHPQNFQEMTYWMLSEVANGNVLVGWHETGVGYFADLGQEIEDGVEILPADHEDVPVLVGVMLMQLVGQSQAQALAQSVEARRMAEARGRIIVPGRTENRKVRRERDRQAAKAERGAARGLIVPGS